MLSYIKKFLLKLTQTYKRLPELVENLDKVIKNQRKTKNYTGSNKQNPPTRVPQQIVVHYTAGEINGRGHVIDWINNPDSKVSYHYIIAYDGTIYSLVKDEYEAWHAGSRSTPYYNENNLSLGVALESPYDQGTPDYTKEQINSCVLLLAHLCRKWDIPCETPSWGVDYHKGDKDWREFKGIMGHESINKRKADPGKNFKWEDIIPAVRFLARN